MGSILHYSSRKVFWLFYQQLWWLLLRVYECFSSVTNGRWSLVIHFTTSNLWVDLWMLHQFWRVDAVNPDQYNIPYNHTFCSSYAMGYPGSAKIRGFSAISCGVFPRISRFYGTLSLRTLLLPSAKHTTKPIPFAVIAIWLYPDKNPFKYGLLLTDRVTPCRGHGDQIMSPIPWREEQEGLLFKCGLRAPAPRDKWYF